MPSPRRWVVGLLVAGLVPATATPWFLAHAGVGVAPYLLHPMVFVVQALPYGLAAALLVPRWSWMSDKAALVVAGLLLAMSLAMYVPMASTPQRWSGDMVALAFLAMSAATAVAILVACTLAGVVLWWHRRRSPAPR